MTVLGIDPGNEESAFCWFDGTVRLFMYGCNREALEWVLRMPHPDIVAIERIASYGMPVGREVFETCFWTGRFIQVAEQVGYRVELIERVKVKSHLCNSAKAKDGNVRQALIDRFGPRGTKKAPGGTYGISGDVWAALAVAVTAWDGAEEGGAG